MAPNSAASAGQAVQRDANPSTASYAKVLRVIGQDLATFIPKTLDITANGESFEARGECHPNPFEAVRESFLNRIWRRVAGKPAAAKQADAEPPACFARTYDADEIERLDDIQSANRRGGSRRADAYSLSERFRTMGAIVDKKKGALKRLHKERDRLFIEYWDAQGQLQSAKLTTVIFYRNQQHTYPTRRNAPTELWEGYDF
jgi:hypothetical protein